MSISWSYGVTTVSSRFKEGLLQRTLDSLKNAGFPEPRLFIDGDFDVSKLPNYRTTVHSQKLLIYGNFHLGLSELFIRQPHADRYAMFQDDFVTYTNLRQYLEACLYPNKGYLNLYTFEQNEKDIKGWYPSNQLGKGAVALVFDNRTVRTLLNSSYWINRPSSDPKNKSRLWKFIDGGIVEALRKEGYKEYVHNPSLVQHTGTKSTLGNSRHSLARTFLGEETDALNLLTKPKTTVRPLSKQRIGLVGYNTATGLGELNRQISKYADVYHWLIKPHSRLRMLERPQDTDFTICPVGAKITKFLDSVDVVVFAEVPYYRNLVDYCKKRGKRVVCIPMMEWMPSGARGWPRQVDLFICPTKHCYDQFAHVVPCVYFPWPVDTKKFKFKHRTTAERFLFINGLGGWEGRKGLSVIEIACQSLPPNTFTVVSQVSGTHSPRLNVIDRIANSEDLYTKGDVLICPHSVDGLGLEPLEALSTGMPIITTDGRPWNEYPALSRIKSRKVRKVVKRPVDWYIPDPAHLVELCNHWKERDISSESSEARTWAKSRSWDTLADKFNELVREGSSHE